MTSIPMGKEGGLAIFSHLRKPERTRYLAKYSVIQKGKFGSQDLS
jgi:hypothetical protein